MRYNLHTHTFYCQHGENTVREYVEEAQRLGIGILGFSEHNPYPDDFATRNKSRMFYKNRILYENDVLEAKKYAKIPVLLGYECDYLQGREEYIASLSENTDYLCFGLHHLLDDDGEIFSPFLPNMQEKNHMEIYGRRFIDALSSGLFLFACHPDNFMCFRDRWGEEEKAVSRDMISAAIDLEIPLEINGNGIEKALRQGLAEYQYPNRNFWELASSMGARAVINMDAHSIASLDKAYARAFAFARELDVQLVEPVLENGKIRIPVHS